MVFTCTKAPVSVSLITTWENEVVQIHFHRQLPCSPSPVYSLAINGILVPKTTVDATGRLVWKFNFPPPQNELLIHGGCPWVTAIIPGNSDASAGQCSGTGMGYRATQWKPHAPSGRRRRKLLYHRYLSRWGGWKETLIMSPDPGLHSVLHLSVQWH